MHFSRQILIAAAVSTCWPITAFADDRARLADIPSITVTGFAHEWRVPDDISATAILTGSGLTPDASMKDLQPATAKALDLVRQAGIQDGDTESSGPNIEALYRHYYDAQGREIMEKREPNGFRATYRLTFKTKSLDTIGKLIPALAEAKATVERIGFSISDEKALRLSLEEQAVTDAVARAKRQISAAGAKPGRVLSIGMISSDVRAPMPLMRAAPAPEKPYNRDFTFAMRPGKQDVEVERQVTVEILPDS